MQALRGKAFEPAAVPVVDDQSLAQRRFRRREIAASDEYHRHLQVREREVGIELERVDLGRGDDLSGLDSASVDYTATSALLGLRAYPYRSELWDVFVGLQAGLGWQGVSATGTRRDGSLDPEVYLPAFARRLSATGICRRSRTRGSGKGGSCSSPLNSSMP